MTVLPPLLVTVRLSIMPLCSTLPPTESLASTTSETPSPPITVVSRVLYGVYLSFLHLKPASLFITKVLPPVVFKVSSAFSIFILIPPPCQYFRRLPRCRQILPQFFRKNRFFRSICNRRETHFQKPFRRK